MPAIHDAPANSLCQLEGGKTSHSDGLVQIPDNYNTVDSVLCMKIETSAEKYVQDNSSGYEIGFQGMETLRVSEFM